MKINRSKLLKLAACGGAGLLLAQSVYAATTLTGTGLGDNADVPADHGSNEPGTPNIALNWSTAPTAGLWDSYNNWPKSPNGQVYQIDGASDGTITHTIVFTPDPGVKVVITQLDLNVWGGGGQTTVDWEVTGDTSGTLGSGTWTVADGAADTEAIGLTGAPGEALTLSLIQTSGRGSYLAMDNLVFDQVAADIPVITSFTADKKYIDASPVTLSWTIDNPGAITTVTLDDGTNQTDVTADTNLTTGDGSIQVSPADNTTYTLSLDGGNSMDLTVLLGEALDLTSDTNLVAAAPWEATLTWEVRPVDAAKVTIFDGTTTIDVTTDTDPATGIGSRAVTVPDPDTTFTVDANDSGNTKSVRVLRAVENSAAFSLDSTTIFDGNPVTVTWAGATGNPDSWIGIYAVNRTPGVQYSNQWNYLNGTQNAGGNFPDGSMQFTLPLGEYYAALFIDIGYTIEQGPILFKVVEQPVVRFPVTVARTGDQITLTWPSKSGFAYDIYASDTLEGDPELDWDPLEYAYPSGGDTTTWTEDLSTLPDGVPAKRFYKIYEYPE